MTDDFFVTCPEGLEAVLVKELQQLGFTSLETGFRGVHLQTDRRGMYRLNYLSRIAGRMLMPIVKFKCRNAQGLYDVGLKKIEWLKYIAPGKTFAIDVAGRHPAFNNTLFAVQVLKDAICDQYRQETGDRPSVNVRAPDVQLHLFLHEDMVLLSVDTSGAPLFKRGYRTEAGEAPMQESLAAAILQLANYSVDDLLLDPCCGSGTFLIEAAYMATQTPSGFLRKKWGFMDLPGFSQEEWQAIRDEEDAKRKPMKGGRLFGIEINKSMATLCRANIRSAGFHKEIQVVQDDFRSYHPAVKPTLIVCNPPHGNRLGDVESLKGLYRSLGDFFKQESEKPGRTWLFTGSLELSKEVGLKPQQRHPIHVSGIDSRLLEFELF